MRSQKALMSMLQSLVKLLSEEAERNPKFADELDALLSPLPTSKPRRKQQNQGLPLESLPDIHTEYSTKGESTFRLWLRDQPIEILRALIRAHDFDARKRTTKWKNIEQLREFIIEQLRARLARGSGFLSSADRGRQFFYTFAALRIGNLSGDRPHPVTVGNYRNFARQWAHEFGDPALGEADDHVLLDPMVLLWKDGRMELKKYDPTRNLWWDFSELRDVRRLVGSGDWTMKLTPEGRAMLATLEEESKLMNKRRADLERLKKVLEDAPRNREFLRDYVRELELHRNEEDVFIRLAFQNVSVGGAHDRGGTFVTSAYSELYDQPLDTNQKREVRQWWYDKVQREAEEHDDLKARLAKLTWSKNRS
jgi:hypothetical protein